MLFANHTEWKYNAFLCNDCYNAWKSSGIENFREWMQKRGNSGIQQDEEIRLLKERLAKLEGK
jgi:hypothetical protein